MTDGPFEKFMAKGRHPAQSTDAQVNLSMLAVKYEELAAMWEEDRSERVRAQIIEELRWLGEKSFVLAGRMSRGE